VQRSPVPPGTEAGMNGKFTPQPQAGQQ
jgi:hypothetical protein